jgi:hypothetical protein
MYALYVIITHSHLSQFIQCVDIPSCLYSNKTDRNEELSKYKAITRDFLLTRFCVTQTSLLEISQDVLFANGVILYDVVSIKQHSTYKLLAHC